MRNVFHQRKRVVRRDLQWGGKGHGRVGALVRTKLACAMRAAACWDAPTAMLQTDCNASVSPLSSGHSRQLQSCRQACAAGCLRHVVGVAEVSTGFVKAEPGWWHPVHLHPHAPCTSTHSCRDASWTVQDHWPTQPGASKQFAVRTGVGVGMQEAGLQQLHQVGRQQRVAQLPHVRRIALAQLLACASGSGGSVSSPLLWLHRQPSCTGDNSPTPSPDTT